MQKLIDGVRRFRSGPFFENRAFFQTLAARRQQPIALFITCADSRINPNLITQTEPGELFILRNVGNIVPPYGADGAEAAAIEYSLDVLGIRDIIVCGHSQCGAVESLLDEERLAHLPAVKRWCDHAEATRRIVRKKYPARQPSELAALAAMENVLVQMDHVATHPAVAARLATDEAQIHGWYYDIGAGVVAQYDKSVGEFWPLGDGPRNAKKAQAACEGAHA